MINLKKVFRFLTLLWMVIIFSFSARNGVISTSDSHHVGMFVGSTFISSFDDWDLKKQISFAEKIDHPIRKMAHASEYSLLGILLAGAAIYIKEYEGSTKKEKLFYKFLSSRYRTAWIIGTLYAASDEFHQLFVPGRSGQLTDVLIDSTGVLVGVLVFFLISKIKKLGEIYV